MVLAVSTLLLALIAAPPADIKGKWEGTLSGQRPDSTTNEDSALLILNQKDGTITGTIGAPRPVNPGTTGTGTTGGSIDSRLVGRWSRTVLLQDDVGAVHASRTTWRFGADAMATRSVVATNLTFGLIDSVVTPARWRTEGGAVVFTYLPEGRGTARFDYFLQGTTLILGGLGFERQ